MTYLETLHTQHVARLQRLSPATPMPRRHKPNVTIIELVNGRRVFPAEPPTPPLPKIPSPIPIPMARIIIRVVAENMNVTIADIYGHSRKHRFVGPRHVAMYLAEKLTTESLPKVGKRFGDRDHATVLNAKRKIIRMMQDDPHFAIEVQHIQNLILDIVRGQEEQRPQ